ncbi:hypothetical protein L202_00459 [Cryptococcus amylolentus CBS 6039]|uniref:3-hydroxyacyl-CoA dehydrogenase type-2 n=2 Tax=Cryptococcus amylolentus TaxID=104669 RepID=A0A1E3I7Q8_9TREE|nr:hypothetical protein L202_00459 [Cryptococcus amylolentus CBS 6039]ODN84528.1 hypothetical protein L202_00459 [Cryptococcus amylolentus CBS 6039]ODO11687.1 hypothetical protein I350_00471 [Cryptococcus amylolentus CBS 6273]
MKIEGKAFVVTGGIGTIGAATAKIIAEKGGYPVIFDILEPAVGEAKIKELPNGDKYYYQQTDISNKESIQTAIKEALQKIPKGSLAGAAHCAGIAPGKPWTNTMSDKIDDFANVLKINTYGTFALNAVVADAINSQYPPLDPFHDRVEEERGSIVNIASIVAFDPPARCLTYGPSKTAVLGITNAAADYLAPAGIRVNSVSPALVFSPLLNKGGRLAYFEEEMNAHSMFPRRVTDASEIGAAILFLIENEMMNAFHLKVDAGWRNVSSWAGGTDPRARSNVLE